MEKLTAADNKFIAEFLDGKNIDFSTEKIVRRNRFTGEEAELCPIAAAAHDFAFRVEPYLFNDVMLRQIHPKLTSKNSVSKFDRARYIVAKLNPKAYMALID
jgi:hypothetical protein